MQRHVLQEVKKRT